MSDYEPTAEMVETACRAAWEGRTGRKWGERSAFSDEARKDARNMLAAVVPMIAAGALREAAAETKTVAHSASVWTGRDGSPEWDTKFREVPVLPQGAPAMLRARADQIEEGRA